MLFISFRTLISEEAIDLNSSKKHSIYFKNNFLLFDAYERDFYQTIFRNYLYNGKEKTNYFEFGLDYNLFGSKFNVESSFFELKKDSYRSLRISCRGDVCFNFIDDVGNYFRTQFKSNLKYELLDNYIFLKGGVRYIKSELTEASSYSFYTRFGQNMIGPNIGLKLSSNYYYNFKISMDVDLFYQRGNFRNEFGTNIPTGLENFTRNETKTGGYSLGTEVELKLSYALNDKIYLAISYSQLKSYLKPKNMFINTSNFNNDLRRNLEFSTLGGNSFEDRFYNTAIEIGFRFD